MFPSKPSLIRFITQCIYIRIIQDPHRVIREIASYLGKEFSDDEVAQLASASSFYSMKRNPNTNYEWLGKEGILDQNVSKYMRKGKYVQLAERLLNYIVSYLL